MPDVAQLIAELGELRQLLQAQQAQITRLETQVAVASAPAAPIVPPGGRRKFLKVLGLSLMAGTALTALNANPAQARLLVDTTLNVNGGTTTATRIGAIAQPRGQTVSNELPSATVTKYGLVASDGTVNLGILTISAGVYGISSNGIGVSGNSSTFYGIYGIGTTGVFGEGATGVRGGSNNGFGVYGSSISDIGVNGTSTSATGIIGETAVSGNASVDNPLAGVYGKCTNGGVNTSGVRGTGANVGVWGIGTGGASSVGVYAESSGTYAGYFTKSIYVNGLVYGNSKAFRIDHPLDPANQYLHHVAIESDQMTNFYSGNVTLNPQGEATVSFPAWFAPLNHDFRYQLTGIGQAAPLYIAQELANNGFKIAGGAANQKVSWQITAVRQDAWAMANPLPVEEAKSTEDKGLYLHPELYNQPPEKSVHYRFAGTSTPKNP